MCNLSFRRQTTVTVHGKVSIKYFWLLSNTNPLFGSCVGLSCKKEHFLTQLCVNFVENPPCFAL